MVKLVPPNSSLNAALELRSMGLQVFPARYKDKPPIVDWRKYQEEKPSDRMVQSWFQNRGSLNFWVMTGRQSGIVVIDCDSPAGEAWWAERVDLSIAAVVKTAKGRHYYFKIPESWDQSKPIQSWSVHPGKDDGHEISFDLRADLTGVVAPPSTHESGVVYTWERPLDEAGDAPLELLDGTYEKQKPPSTGGAGGGVVGTGGVTRSMLSRLLAQPPGGDGSGRNDWLARVAGHYAKTYHKEEDNYISHCERANAMMGTPLPRAEFEKTVASVWKGEHTRNTHRAVDAKCGYLVSGESVINCQVRIKRGDESLYDFEEYADFDLKAKGVMCDEDGRRTYWAEIVRRRRGGDGDLERIDVVLRAEVLGDDRALRKFLAGYACTIIPPDNISPKSGSIGIRLQRYMESQQPPVVEITPALGYHPEAVRDGGGFVTHDNIITASGVVGLNEALVRADPRLKASGVCDYEYGFEGTLEEAKNVLREVLTFHDETVCAVYGAWWAACLLKPQIEDRTSLFPFMAVEAPSESGKTNGYFSMMMQLSGSTRGEIQPTRAALRDMAASNRNGGVWVDDLDDPANLMELFRAATSGGSLTKMDEDRTKVKNTQIVSPIVISGENLGLETQKALVDRAIILKTPSPVGRRSRYDASRPQWDDILDMREAYPAGLHTVSGWLVQAALGVEEQVLAALRAARTGGSGRAADKVAVLRAGARLLDYLTGHDEAWAGTGQHSVAVEKWLLLNDIVSESGIAVTSNENALTLELLPWVLREWKFPDKASAGQQVREMDTPAFVRNMDPDAPDGLFGDTAEVWFSLSLVAEAWEDHKRGRNEKRTTTEMALRDQADALGCKSKRVKLAQSGGRLAYYRVLSGPVAKAVVARALGR